jgi:hypothetical protein
LAASCAWKGKDEAMRFLRIWIAKIIGLLTQKRQDHEFDEEIQAHLHDLTERYRRQGMSRADAATAARRQFGNVTLLQETQRAQRSFLSPSEWWGDIRFGMRMMMKKPGSNAAVIIALALGIGMNVAVFSFVNALLLRPPAAVGGMEVSWKSGSTRVSPRACKVIGPSPILTTPTTATTADLSKACLPLMEMAPRQSGIVPAKARWCGENSSPGTSFRCSE